MHSRLRVMCRESGVSLVETVIALAILATIAVTFLSGLAGTSRAAFMTDEQATAESLARSQIEWVQNAQYVPSATQYSLAPIPGGRDYTNYSANITVSSANVTGADANIQKITVTIQRSGKVILNLEGYKVNR